MTIESLTSCLCKVLERLIKQRLYKLLENKNILVEAQSGFREKRGAGDSLLFVTQKINETFSRCKKVCGLFFESVLGPLLFLIYINDIHLAQLKHHSFSTLYADDLGAFFIFNSPKSTEKLISIYLNKLTSWLSKWRLVMNVKKCNYIIFSNVGNTNKKSKKLNSI